MVEGRHVLSLHQKKWKALKKMMVTGRLFIPPSPLADVSVISSSEQLVVRWEAETHQRWDRQKWPPTTGWLKCIDLDNFQNKEHTHLNTVSAELHTPNKNEKDLQEPTEGWKQPQTGIYHHVCSFRRGLWTTWIIADLQGGERHAQMLVFRCLVGNRIATIGLVGMES